MSRRDDFQLFRVGNVRVAWEYSAGPLTGVLLGVRTGSRFDGRHPGIAHFTEHMVFQGTSTSGPEELNARAAHLGGEHQALTGFETVEISFRVRNEDLEEGLELLAEEVFDSTIPEDRFRNERQVILQEIRGYRDDPTAYLADGAWARFHGGPLAVPPFGTPEGVRSIRPQTLRRYLDERFVGANIVLGIVGGVRRSKLEGMIRRTFGHVPWGKRQKPKPAHVRRTGRLRFQRQGMQQSYVNILAKAPSSPRELLALALANEALGTDPDGRLYREVRERRGLSYDLDSSIHSGDGWAVFEVQAACEGKALPDLLQVVEEVFAEAEKKGITDEEFRRARRKLEFAFACLEEGKVARAEQHVDAVLLKHAKVAERRRWLRQIRREEVERAWRRVRRAESLVATLSGK